jgi:hypothetical protein
MHTPPDLQPEFQNMKRKMNQNIIPNQLDKQKNTLESEQKTMEFKKLTFTPIFMVIIQDSDTRIGYLRVINIIF